MLVAKLIYTLLHFDKKIYKIFCYSKSKEKSKIKVEDQKIK
ncbi:hypothetical protein HMPREF1983_00226 [Gemella bergeri ATCC 700627]|uniref:Uncharacterized protein n=1 Tax=Gemella bergeri ATCC 700627 TaxID=1321820 RepID=U2QUP9_9BACL|nr:hypothetical protein HMPREF1983_00226 [Gemella bergeri ATCC 700627]